MLTHHGLLRCSVSHALKILEMSGGGAVQLPTADSVRFFLQSCCDAQRQGAPTPAVSAVQVRNQLSCCACAGEDFTWAREPRLSE